MIEDLSKSNRQAEGIDKWRLNNGKGTLNWAMRFGKTYGACTIINKFTTKNPLGNVKIIVPNETLANQWKDYIAKYASHSHTKVYSINDYDPSPCDLLILDEIHKYGSDTRIKVFEINRKYILGLTGTPPNDEHYSTFLNNVCPTIDTITETEALANHWIAPYKEYNIKLKMDSNKERLYNEYSQGIVKFTSIFKGTAQLLNRTAGYQWFESDFNVIMGAYMGCKYQAEYMNGATVRELLSNAKGWTRNINLSNDYNRTLDEYWNPIAIEDNAKAYSRCVRMRNELINTSVDKINVVKELITKFKGTKTIIYNESIEMCNYLQNELEDDNRIVSFHSKLDSRPLIDPDTNEYYTYKGGAKAGQAKKFSKDKIKEYIIEGLKEDRYDILTTVKSLDEGLNVENVELIITTAGTLNPIQHKQRTARGKTINPLKLDKVAFIINIYFDNTNDFRSRDLSKLILRQQMSENVVNWVDSADEIIL